MREARTHGLGATQTGTRSRIDYILVRAATAFGGSKVLYGVGLPLGGNRDHQPLQCRGPYTTVRSSSMWNRSRHGLQSSPRRIEGLIRREVCHRSAFGSDGMVRSTSTAERPRRVRNLENHQAKCQCGFADQPVRQAKGHIERALTMETPHLVRVQHIFTAYSLHIVQLQT